MTSNTSASQYVHLNVFLKECISNPILPQVERKDFFEKEQGQVTLYACLVMAEFSRVGFVICKEGQWRAGVGADSIWQQGLKSS